MGDTPVFRALSAQDVDTVMALITEAGWPHRRVDIANALDLGHGFALFDETSKLPYGMGAWWPIDEASARLGLIVVSQSHRGRGVGRQIVEHLLYNVGSRRVALLATQAGRTLYERAGFRCVEPFSQLQGRYTAFESAVAHVRLASERDYANILALDYRATGLHRQRILQHLFQVGRTWVLSKADQLDGYAIARDFGKGGVVGPIIATTQTAAIALFRASAPTGFVRVDIPQRCRRLARELQRNGLSCVDIGTEMCRGEPSRPHEKHRLMAMSGHAWG